MSHRDLAFSGLLIFLKSIYDRRNRTPSYPVLLEGTSEDGKSQGGEVTPDMLQRCRQRKEQFFQGAEIFNSSAKKGLEYFVENSFLPTNYSHQELADFFVCSSHLNKSIIGDYIGKKDNEDFLAEYVKKFNFLEKRIDEALRMFLEKFRLPGESQIIDRILSAFSKQYFNSIASDPEKKIASEDAVFILAFSVIMLNTDLHNPQNPRRMSFADFKRNLRGTNENQDFDDEYLNGIYVEIRDNEIILPEEHGGELAFNFQWAELLGDYHKITKLSTLDTNVFDKDMFSRVWAPIASSIIFMFENLEDSFSLSKVLNGLHQIVTLAAQYEQSEVVDFIVMSLLKVSGITQKSKTLPTEIDFAEPNALESLQGEGKFADRWAAELGQNTRGKLAVVFIFDMINEFADCLSKSWTIVRYFLNR
jgi:Sec7-like guanine-nucleotide exchange factor